MEHLAAIVRNYLPGNEGVFGTTVCGAVSGGLTVD
jgi:hypothetical protein